MLERESQDFQSHFTQALRSLDKLILQIVYSAAGPDPTQSGGGSRAGKIAGEELHERSALGGLGAKFELGGTFTHKSTHHAKRFTGEQL